MLDAAIYTCASLVLVGCICLGYLGVGGGFYNQRMLALVITYVTLVFVLTGAFLYFYQNLRQDQQRLNLSISVQLMPPIPEQVGKDDDTTVNQVLVIFVNNTPITKTDTHLTLRMPKILKVVLDDPKRVLVEGGGDNATYVHLSVPEMVPNEKRVVTIDVEPTKAPTAEDWKQLYKYSDGIVVYRLRIGPEKPVVGSTEPPLPLPRYTASFSAVVMPNRGERALRGNFWLAYDSRRGKSLSPVSILLFVSVKNLQNAPARIETYTIDAQNKRGQWVRLWRMDTVGGTMYAVTQGKDFKRAVRVDLSYHGFDLSLIATHKQDVPDNPIEGWVLLDHPDGFDPLATTPFRMNIRDKDGEITVQMSQASPVKKEAAIITKEAKDLRRYNKGFYSEIVGS